jgi:hypothetical protein
LLKFPQNLIDTGLIVQDTDDELPVDVLTTACSILKYFLCLIKVNQGLRYFELSFLVDFVLGSIVKKGDFGDEILLVEKKFVHVMVREFDGVSQLFD